MDTRQEKIDYVWSYFELHANQRMSTFNFYIVIAALTTNAIATSYESITQSLFPCAIFSMLLSFVSYIFWKLDQRCSKLIKHAEESLKALEAERSDDSGPGSACLFTEESKLPSTSITDWKIWSYSLSYSKCFTSVFAAFGSIGLLSFVYCMVLIL